MQEHNELPSVRSEYLHLMPIDEAKQWYDGFVAFSKSLLKADHDYGIIPGTPKPSLYKPGAEKLRFAYSLGTEVICIDKVVDLSIPLIDYTYKCIVKKNGITLAECEGSCNSMETKYGYLWKQEHELPAGTDLSKLPVQTKGKKISEFDFAINKAETTGQYGKPAEYWEKFRDAIDNGTAIKKKKKTTTGKNLDCWEIDETVTVYRVVNPDVMNYKNTIMKMAQKRAFVGAILLATGASEFFTQDVEDLHDSAPPVDSSPIEDAEIINDESEMEACLQWQDKLKNECKSPADVDEWALKHKDVLSNWPALYNYVKEYKKILIARSKVAV